MLDTDHILAAGKATAGPKKVETLGKRIPGSEYFSIQDLAERWHCSRGTVYNRLRFAGAKVLDFSLAGRRSKKLVAAQVVLKIEARFTRSLS